MIPMTLKTSIASRSEGSGMAKHYTMRASGVKAIKEHFGMRAARVRRVTFSICTGCWEK